MAERKGSSLFFSSKTFIRDINIHYPLSDFEQLGIIPFENLEGRISYDTIIKKARCWEAKVLAPVSYPEGNGSWNAYACFKVNNPQVLKELVYGAQIYEPFREVLPD